MSEELMESQDHDLTTCFALEELFGDIARHFDVYDLKRLAAVVRYTPILNIDTKRKAAQAIGLLSHLIETHAPSSAKPAEGEDSQDINK